MQSDGEDVQLEMEETEGGKTRRKKGKKKVRKGEGKGKKTVGHEGDDL
jgi:hypothetical protein